MTRTTVAALAAVACLAQPPAAQAKTQFVPALLYGTPAAGSFAITAGLLDYLQLLNARDGGINGVKFTWEKCATAYDNARGVECYERLKGQGPTGATLVHPLSTGIAYSLLERAARDRIPLVSLGYGRADAADGRVFKYVFPLVATYWDQAAAMVRYIGQEEGGFDRLRGRKIGLLHHASEYGREPIPVLAELAKKYGYELVAIPVPPPGRDQAPQWKRILEVRPDWLILWGWGPMNAAALKAASEIGYPRARMLGVWGSGAADAVAPLGAAAKDFVVAGLDGAGADYPVIGQIRQHVYANGAGDLSDPARIGSPYYNRGVALGIVTAEAVRAAQRRFGRGRPVTGAQVQWALERLDLDEKRLRALGASGLMPPIETSCRDHAGSGAVRFLRWDGGRWQAITGWVEPLPDDRDRVRAKSTASALAYAKEKGIKPRTCAAG